MMNNIRQVKLSSPDYTNVDPDEAAKDFLARIAHYEEAYETIGADKGSKERTSSFTKLINLGSQVMTRFASRGLTFRSLST